MPAFRARFVWGAALALWLSIGALACYPGLPRPPTPTPDYPALETRVAAILGATMTARAPIPTQTPLPTETPRPPASTATPAPTASPSPPPTVSIASPPVAFVRLGPDQAANIVLREALGGQEEILTHFAEPLGITSLSWSQDGEWMVFASAHDFIRSREDEYNVFMMRYDGSDLHMVTGDYIDPEKAAGPFVPLTGWVMGAKGTCLVYAQGAANPVEADDATGRFELPAVPLEARWARAVCRDGEAVFQGSADLVRIRDALVPVNIRVEPRGQGWQRVALSKTGALIGGTFYRWVLDEEGHPRYAFDGVIVDLEAGTRYTLTLPAETTFLGLDWSPKGGAIVAALTTETGTSLWLFAPDGTALRPLVEIPNPEQEILTAANPAWSPNGEEIAFELRHWYWWGENQYRTDLMLVSAEGENLRPLVETAWGEHATSPSWAPHGKAIYFQLAKAEPGTAFHEVTGGDIYFKWLEGEEIIPWTDDGVSLFPAVRPAP